MQTYQVNILNPKAAKLLQDLAELNLIAIKQISEDSFLKLINKLRSNAGDNSPSLDEITREVERVRAKRYDKTKDRVLGDTNQSMRLLSSFQSLLRCCSESGGCN